MKYRIILLAILAILCVVMGAGLESTRPGLHRDKIMGDRDANSVLLGMLGEIRYTLAAFIWLKADYYHHEYELNNKDWKKNEALMSLVKLVTILDPHFIQAYDFGAYHLAVNLNHYDEAYEFLREGLKFNPESFELNWETGFLLLTQKKYSEALPYLHMALKECGRNTYMDQSVMKREWVVSRLTECYTELKQWDEAVKYCHQWIELNPELLLPRYRLEYIENERKKQQNPGQN